MVRAKITPRRPATEDDQQGQPIKENKKQNKTDEAVTFFTNAPSSTKVRGNVTLSLSMTTLEETSKSSGLSHQHIQQLIDVAASGCFPVMVSSRLVKCLLPESTIPEDAVLSAVSWMCTNKPSSELQALLIKWMILTYDLIESRQRLHALYGVIFQFIENDTLCPHVCHLLYLLTRKEDVVGFRVRRLLELQKRMGIQSHITGLLSVYKLYRPYLVSLAVPSTQKVYFRQTERVWRAHVNTTKERIAAAGNLDESVYSRLHGTLTEKGPVTKRQRLEIVPRITATSIMREAEEAHYRLSLSAGGAASGRVQIQDITSFEDLLENMDTLELPSQVAAVLRSPFLQHIISCHRQQHVIQRLSFWLYQTLGEELVGGEENQRGEELLQMLINFTDFLQEDVPVCEDWLVKYLDTWNGMDYRPYILRLIMRFRIHQFPKLNDLILEPLRNLFFCSTIYFKCQLVYCFTELLRNYVLLELPRYQDSVAMRKVQASAAVQTGNADVTLTGHSLFDSHVDHFEALQTIQNFIQFADRLFAMALQLERDNTLLMHHVLLFYELVSQIHTKYHVPFTSLPSPGIVYRALFSSNAMTCSRICAVLARYKTEYSSLKKNTQATNNMFAERWKGHSHLLKEYSVLSDLSSQVNLLNGFILDVSNSLWRNKAFVVSPSNKAPSVFNIPTDIVEGTDVERPGDIFSLHHHIALVGYAKKFLQETQPEGKRVHPSLIRGDIRDTYLEFLKTERVDGVVSFISTFIKRSSSTK